MEVEGDSEEVPFTVDGVKGVETDSGVKLAFPKWCCDIGGKGCAAGRVKNGVAKEDRADSRESGLLDPNVEEVEEVEEEGEVCEAGAGEVAGADSREEKFVRTDRIMGFEETMFSQDGLLRIMVRTAGLETTRSRMGGCDTTRLMTGGLETTVLMMGGFFATSSRKAGLLDTTVRKRGLSERT